MADTIKHLQSLSPLCADMEIRKSRKAFIEHVDVDDSIKSTTTEHIMALQNDQPESKTINNRNLRTGGGNLQ